MRGILSKAALETGAWEPSVSGEALFREGVRSSGSRSGPALDGAQFCSAHL